MWVKMVTRDLLMLPCVFTAFIRRNSCFETAPSGTYVRDCFETDANDPMLKSCPCTVRWKVLHNVCECMREKRR